MEFKFRDIDDRRATATHRTSFSPSPSSQSMSYLSEQALRGKYLTEPNFMHNPRDFYTIEREIEKERIRHEIITAEIAHRRVLEDEVRRELMLERDMVMHSATKTGVSIDEWLSMQLRTRYPFTHQFNNSCLEDRFPFPGNRSVGFGHDLLPPTLPPTLPQFSGTVREEIMSALEVNKKDKLIVLAKPDPRHCGSKRKAATPPAGSRELTLKSSKKPKEWSCAICQVSATSERGLDEHLQGKKHKAKEAGLLKAQKMCNASTTSMSKRSRKKIKCTESKNIAGRETETELENESVDEVNQSVTDLDQNVEDLEDSKNTNEELPKKRDLNAKPQETNGIPIAEKRKRKRPLTEKFKFWCEDCQVGTYSAVVMEDHKRGKKHKARSIGSKKKDEDVPSTNSMSILAASVHTGKSEEKMSWEKNQMEKQLTLLV